MLNADKSKKRVERHSITQEDFTPESVITSLLSKVDDFSVNKTFLDNSCGIGNILIAVLKKKLSLCKNQTDIENALKSIYGVELMADNVEECRNRIYDMVISKYSSIKDDAKLNNRIRSIIKNRIQWYDSLKFNYNEWPKIINFKTVSFVDFKEKQTDKDTKYPMWYKENSEPTLFDGIKW